MYFGSITIKTEIEDPVKIELVGPSEDSEDERVQQTLPPWKATICSESEYEFEGEEFLKSEIKIEETQFEDLQQSNPIEEYKIRDFRIVLKPIDIKAVFACEKCPQMFRNRSNFIFHKRSCNEKTIKYGKKMFECDQCPCEYYLKSHLIVHQKSFHRTDGKSVACEKCSKIFINEAYLKIHMETHNDKRLSVKKLNECHSSYQKEINKKIGRKIYKFACEECSKVFSTGVGLSAHKRIHTNTKQSVKKFYECHLCHQKVTSMSAIHIHMRSHSGDTPFGCTKCSKKFKSSNNLNRHQMIHTGGEKRFACNECDSRFHYKSELNFHKIRHTGERKYVCSKCPLAFINANHLKRHEKIHSGTKLFACDQCPMKFIEKYTLMQHKYTHTGEQPYSCKICLRKFSFSGNLLRHTRTKHKK